MAIADQRAFLRYAREDAPKRPVEERRGDWLPIQDAPESSLLARQASRCMGCGVPFCQGPTGCPLDNLIPDWNELVRAGRMQEALAALHATNNFPELTGFLCPAPCESACVLDLVSEPVTIRGIEAGIVEHGFAQGWVQPQPAAVKSGRRVAIVGSGPAGLAAAQQLARAGHKVVVFDKAARPGGLLRYGIPDFKLDKSLIDRRLDQMIAEGVEFRSGVEIGRDLDADALQRDFHAVCLAIGAGAARDLEVPGRELVGIHLAMDYLTLQNRALAGELVSDRSADFAPSTGRRVEAAPIDAAGKRVVIIGGGDTGSDCLGTAHRQGCADVVQLELLPRPPLSRSEATPWPYWPLKLSTSHAHEEGGRRDWRVCTIGFEGDAAGQVTGVRTQRCELRGGRLELVPDTEMTLPADLVLLAIGFMGPDLSRLQRQLPVALDERGNIRTDASYATSLPGIFAAGDARRGASLIVWAIAEGRKMAAAVDSYLRRC